MLDFCVPQIEAMCEEDMAINEANIYQWLETTTLVGILPLPHSIKVRKYQPSAYTDLWFSTYIWG